MKNLTLQEIIALPKASVIWREEHTSDDISGHEFYEVEPMLVCVAGEGGVLAFANKDSFLDLDIDENLITDYRRFWDEEPDESMITEGVPVEDYNTFCERFNILTFARPGLLSAITKKCYTVEQFCERSGISLEDMRSALIGEKELTPAEKETICSLLNITDDHVFDDIRKGRIIEMKKAALRTGVTESCRVRI